LLDEAHSGVLKVWSEPPPRWAHRRRAHRRVDSAPQPRLDRAMAARIG